MKPVYVGTYFDPEAARSLKVRAAEEGTSASALLRSLALAYIGKPAKTPRTKKKGAGKP